VCAYCCMLERHTTQALHLLWLIESGANSVCWGECPHLLLSYAGETRNTSAASTTVTHWNWVEQTELIHTAINWVECQHIATCWRDTQHKHCIYCDSLKVDQSVFVIAIEWSVCMHVFWKARKPTCILLKRCDFLSQNISAVNKGQAKKVQVTEWPKDVISLWGQEENLYQLGCVYRTPA